MKNNKITLKKRTISLIYTGVDITENQSIRNKSTASRKADTIETKTKCLKKGGNALVNPNIEPGELEPSSPCDPMVSNLSM